MPANLFTIPPELRSQIFTHLTTPITITTCSHQPLTVSPPYPWPITGTCKSLRAESEPHLHRTKIHLTCLHGHFPNTLRQRLPDAILQRITHITLQAELTLRSGTTVPLARRAYLEGTSNLLASTNVGPITLIDLENHTRVFPALQSLHLSHPLFARGVRQLNPRQWFFDTETYPRAHPASTEAYIRRRLAQQHARSYTYADVPADVFAFMAGMFVGCLRDVLARFKGEMEAPREGLERDYLHEGSLLDLIFGPLDWCAAVDGEDSVDPWDLVSRVRRRRGFEVKVSALTGATYMHEDGVREYIRHVEEMDFDFLASTVVPAVFNSF